MHRHCCIVIGRLKLENWRLYIRREHCSAKNPNNRWQMWDRVL
jgi:hypothetical protein